MTQERNTLTKTSESKEEVIRILNFLHDESKLSWKSIADEIGVDYTVIMKWKENGSWGAVMGVRIMTLAQELGFDSSLTQKTKKQRIK